CRELPGVGARRSRLESRGNRHAGRAARAVGMLRRQVSGAVPAPERGRRATAGGAVGVHQPHRAGALGDPGACPGNRESLLCCGAGAVRLPSEWTRDLRRQHDRGLLGTSPAARAARPRLRGGGGGSGAADGRARELPGAAAPRPGGWKRTSVSGAPMGDSPVGDPLQLARDLILRPSGLDDGRLDRVFGEVLAHSVDFADLYFQLARQESWSLEDGMVKDGSASIEQGVGVRALAGEKTGFAYSDEIVLPALEEASRAARAIALHGGERRVSPWRTQTGHRLYLPADPAAALATPEKIAWLVAGERPLALARAAVRQALVNLEARPAPAGTMTVVLGPGWPGILLHEAIGHGLEGDFNRKGTSAFAGRIGEQVAAPECTVVDDGTLTARRGSLNIDDEGTPTQCTILIENGVLRGYMQDRLNARLMGAQPTGNGRRESFAHMTLPRMTNTYMRPGPHAPEEIIRSVQRGIYAVNFGGGQVDITSGKFVFSASEAYAIEN